MFQLLDWIGYILTDYIFFLKTIRLRVQLKH